MLELKEISPEEMAVVDGGTSLHPQAEEEMKKDLGQAIVNIITVGFKQPIIPVDIPTTKKDVVITVASETLKKVIDTPAPKTSGTSSGSRPLDSDMAPKNN